VNTSETVTSENNFGGTVDITAADFHLKQQSVLLGLQWNFI
jgi:hypothetical protein